MGADATRAVVIGGGHNGLAAAFYLARAGWSPLVLERQAQVGGGAITEEIHPGFRCPTLAHHVLLWADIVHEMGLPERGGALLTPDVEVFAPDLDGGPLVVYGGARSGEIAGVGSKDREAFTEYRATMTRLGSVLSTLLESPPPANDMTPAGIWHLLQTGRRFRALGKRDAYRLLRWATMPAADLTGEWFDSDLLRAVVAGPGVSGVRLGTRSGGGALVMMLQAAHHLLAGHVVRARGGPGALTQAMAAAAAEAGAVIRTSSAVDRIVVERDRVTGVMCGGEMIPTSTVVSAVDPKTTFLRLIDAGDLDPSFLQRVRNYRAAGTMGKVNLALSGLPPFIGATDATMLSGRIHIGPSLDYMERAFDDAKYGELSTAPWLDVTVPSILDPTLAPGGAHVLSAYVHYAPLPRPNGAWQGEPQRLLDTALGTLERFAPGIGKQVIAGQAITPLQLERDYGLSGGHVHHGDLTLDQLFSMRPFLGVGRYATPVEGLHLCGAGTHPGGFMSGASGRHAARFLTNA